MNSHEPSPPPTTQPTCSGCDSLRQRLDEANRLMNAYRVKAHALDRELDATRERLSKSRASHKKVIAERDQTIAGLQVAINEMHIRAVDAEAGLPCLASHGDDLRGRGPTPEESPPEAVEDTPEASALLDAMHDYSEERCAGWLTNMEFYLWSAVARDGKHDSGVGEVFARRLRHLAADAGGWWVHCSTVNADWKASGGRVFLTTAAWRTLYAAGPREAL